MADPDWKKRIGIAINFSPETSDDDENDEVTNCKKSPRIATPNKISKLKQSTNSHNLDSSSIQSDGDDYHSSLDASSTHLDILLNEYGDYGNTPPRTRILRRARERRQREEIWEKKSPKVIHAKTRRRNTLDSIYFTELLERSKSESNNLFPETSKTENIVTIRDTTPNSRRISKRSQKLLRDSERSMKQQIDEPIVTKVRHSMPPTFDEPDNERAESLPPMLNSQPAIKVETSKRFMSLISKPISCKVASKTKDLHSVEQTNVKNVSCSQERINFYNTFSLLIRMGSPDKPPDKCQRNLLSKEDYMWQNELKDLIWLELQAWHADRSVMQQDQYICEKRESVHLLLEEIINYRFTAKDLTCDHGPRATSCSREGCLSIFCKTYLEAQNAALFEVEQLMNRLEAAEALYPSSKAFGLQHPLYRSSSFVGRVKAMCLWYNMTKHHRLKLLILSKLLTFPKCGFRSLLFPSEHNRFTSESSDERWSGSSSGIGTSSTGSIDDVSHHDFFNFSRSASVESSKKSKSNRNLTVHFEPDVGGSPSDSNNSTASSQQSSAWSDSGNSSLDVSHNIEGQLDFYNVVPMSVFCKQTCPSNPYRKYIESVLKTRGLRKSLTFLDKLYKYVLHSARISLEKPTSSENDSSSSPTNNSELLENNEEELKRFGFWSEEAKALGLPSYRSWYLFLSRIPLDFIHEFIRMRLEHKPEQPSILSIRQLMRELKEGLMIAVLYRERYLDLVEKALWDCEEESLTKFREGVNEFDASIKSLLEVYLDYLKQWVQMVQQDSFQKNLLEEEWNFVKGTFPNIPGGNSCAGESFCKIASSNLQVIGDSLCSIVDELTKNIDNTLNDKTESPKQIILSICRDFQSLLTQIRERALKAVAFAKSLRKDLEADSEEILSCCRINEAVAALKTNALALGKDIRESLLIIEDICDVRDMTELDDIDRAALQSRCREVIHLGYKFGFEYLKEAYRLVTGEARAVLSRRMITFASLWMRFVKDRCDRGRGLRPRWANQGLDFLMCVCEPQNTACLNDEEFQSLKNQIDECISHVIGVASPSANGEENGNGSSSSILTCASPILGRRHRIMPPPFRTSRSVQETTSTTPPPSASIIHGRASLSGPPIHQSPSIIEQNNDAIDFVEPEPPLPRIQRVRWAVRSLDSQIEKHLKENELIGNVTDIDFSDHGLVRSKSVNFIWQRGIKIGQGRFGKVYTAVNNKTGELMAMKEIQLQPNDHRTIRKVVEELKIFEGINHKHLVRYYGLEIHREEMLIFMEFCAEGTLESLVAGTEIGLPEAGVRRYTKQLLLAVNTLHHHGIGHRDVKSANIFLTDEGNCLKLGDFGSAVKIKAHTTMPGELQGFVGTQAYMAPEVFMKNNTEGHGRAADIWSVGCVVIEMASGKRPWTQFDSNYQIMFKVGMGESPEVPETLCREGQDFLELCLQHDPRNRSSASELLCHSFVRIENDEDDS